MKNGILITARLGSTRLARKHLLPLGNWSAIGLLIERVRHAGFSPMLAVSNEAENEMFEQYVGRTTAVFYGAPRNIPLRHLQAAQRYDLTGIVSIDGDDLYCSILAVRQVLAALEEDAEYVRTEGLPLGMNCCGYSTDFLQNSLVGHETQVLETGWNRIFDQARLQKKVLHVDGLTENLRFTLDYPEDYEFFKALVGALGDRDLEATNQEVVDAAVQGGLYKLNAGCIQKYWRDFTRSARHENHASGPILWAKAKKLIPGGNQLLSKRSERFLPGFWPAYYSKARGCEVWDLDGNHYYDFAQMGVGCCTLGYADPDVDGAVAGAISSGSMCTLNCPEEVELAERLIALHPWADMARFARTGGEACAIAIRIARAATGRDHVLFCSYSGWHDWYISANLQDAATLDGQLMPGLGARGVPQALKGTALGFQYNHLDELETLAELHGNKVAVIIMEPCRSVLPEPGFLAAVREIANRIGAILIFDEITSGFRMNLGGIHMKFGVEPDIAVFAKALGNGFPIAAVIGCRAVMEHAADTFISSTFWTERIGFVAALATLKKMEKDDVQKDLVRFGERLNAGWARLAEEHGLDVRISGIAPLTHIEFDVEEPLVAQTFYTQEMLVKGYLLGAAVYTTVAYTDEIIDQFLVDSDSVFARLKHHLDLGDLRKQLEADVIQPGFRRLV